MCTPEFNEQQLAVLNELEAAIPLAVKLQREHGDTTGALNALRDVVNKAIGMDTRKDSFESFRRALMIEQAFDKARLVYQRAKLPIKAVASGIVSYFMGIKRLAAIADYEASVAAEERDPQYQVAHEIEPDDARQAAVMWESEAKEHLAQAFAAMTNAAILAEATRLLKKMKMDVALADNILSAVSQPPNNPWEMFNAVMAALGH